MDSVVCKPNKYILYACKFTENEFSYKASRRNLMKNQDKKNINYEIRTYLYGQTRNKLRI